ncbi:MAG: O-antigen ligase family protein [Candidatus Omnitrophica bacterium]|nr:O-antigen ligase family protein [Candidatus Omnitrophota bacterium]
MKSHNKENVLKSIDTLGLALIGCLSLGYCLFSKRFAELHIDIHFLDFPVFIGEIILILCLFLFIFKLSKQPLVLNFKHYLIFFYFFFVIVKAFYGYYTWGPLAFRHSALFYYPVFALFGYTFYRREFFNIKLTFILIILLTLLPLFSYFYSYYLLPCIFLNLVLIFTLGVKKIKYTALFLVTALFPFKDFFDTSRTSLVANIFTLVFVIFYILCVIKIKKIYRLIVFLLIFFLILIAAFELADNNAVKSIIDIEGLADTYRYYDDYITPRYDSFQMVEIEKVKVYNPEFKPEQELNSKVDSVQVKISQIEEEMKLVKTGFSTSKGRERLEYEAEKEAKDINRSLTAEKTALVIEQLKNQISEIKNDIFQARDLLENTEFQEKDKVMAEIDNMKSKVRLLEGKLESIEPELSKTENRQQKAIGSEQNDAPSKRRLQAAVINSLFRVFIWRDMVRELRESRPWFGFDFGKPLRSKSLEILHWADVDWKRDGWITAHNSFLHIIYRSGLIGIVCLFSFAFMFIKNIISGIKLKSLNIGFLFAALLSWLVIGNFLVILELPYNAICFWSLLGMTLAYINGKKKSFIK